MKKVKLFIPLIIVVSATAFLLASNFSTPLTTSTEGSDLSLKYTGVVCIGVNEPAEQGICKHNLFTNFGQNLTRQALTIGTEGIITEYIAIGNNSGVTQLVTDVILEAGTLSPGGEMGTECNLGRAVGTIRNVTAGCTVATCPGNWSVTYEWTYSSSCAGVVRVNTTGIFPSTTVSTLFAENTFTNADLSPNDKINVTWFIWVV